VPQILEELLDTLAEIARDVPIVLPLHPRTRRQVEACGLGERIASGVGSVPSRGLVGLEPLSYLQMLETMAAAAFVLTDSGGIQEETTALGVPCVTLRENTERPITVSEGTNVLAGLARRDILAGLAEAQRKARDGHVPERWDGRAGERIVATLRTVATRGTERRRPVPSGGYGGLRDPAPRALTP
jgi:UDP-N-acetylglucosamine 2-epimerase (non-hydrolysing)